MKAPIIILKRLPASGMTIFPFIFLKQPEFKSDKVLLNHEKIHLRQQLELLIIPFYLLYLLNYLINLVKHKSHYSAYRNIIFEQEAFTHDHNLIYLSKNTWYNWMKFI